ncbi:hypothetical protein F5Y11DRAFT_347656 [Daldinia sp. FL1419]|nr:hypothetical protein F5Y11DRAFT_347656 [Daldinia sp. FL1419]
MNTYAKRSFLFALMAFASGLDAEPSPSSSSPEITSVSMLTRFTTLTTTKVVTACPFLSSDTSTASKSIIAGGILGEGSRVAASTATEAPTSLSRDSCVTVIPNLSILPPPLPITLSPAVVQSTEESQNISSTTILWPLPGNSGTPDTPPSASDVRDTTTSLVVTSSAPDTATSITSLERSNPQTPISTALGGSTSRSSHALTSTSSDLPISTTSHPQSSTTGNLPASTSSSLSTSTSSTPSTSTNSDLPTSTSIATLTTGTLAIMASVSTVTTSITDGTGHGEATAFMTAVNSGSSDGGPSSLSPTTPPLSTYSPTTTIQVSAIDHRGRRLEMFRG